MMKLPRYPEYKKARVSWIGSIPAHWPENRAKYFFKEIDERSQTGDEEMLSVSHITGVTPRSQKNVTMFKAESNVGQKLCQPGDVVINTMWAWMSALGVSAHAGIVSPAYGVYRPRSNRDYDNYYLDHLLRVQGYRSEYICRSTGIRSSRLRLYPDRFLCMPVICPPQEEQQAIARFLKGQDHLFRKFIRSKRRLIELLKEQKQNVINRAVTRGVDANVKLKPSGVEWITHIPEHWNSRKLLYATSLIVDGTHFSPSNSESGDFLYITAKNIKETGVTVDNATYIKAEDHASIYKRCPVKKGDVVYIKDGATAGIACVNQLEAQFSMLSSVALIKPDICVLQQHYLAYQLNCQLLKKFLLRNLVGGAMTRFTIDLIKKFPIICPPLEEQQNIVDTIREETAPIDQSIIRAQREIDLMREYRTRLISDVVTGKVDVRGIEVPEIAEEELLALDDDNNEPDDIIDDEGEMDEAD